MSEQTRQLYLAHQQENAQAFANLVKIEDDFADTIDVLAERLRSGGKLLFCGNGGSASSASHMVNDCVGHMYIDRPPIAAVSLSDNMSVVSAIANDYGFVDVFDRQVQAIGNENDVLIAISTSGNSKNILKAAETAKKQGVLIVGLTDRQGGALRALSDHWLWADTDDPVCAEHVHLFLLHTLTAALEDRLYPDHPRWKK